MILFYCVTRVLLSHNWLILNWEEEKKKWWESRSMNDMMEMCMWIMIITERYHVLPLWHLKCIQYRLHAFALLSLNLNSFYWEWEDLIVHSLMSSQWDLWICMDFFMVLEQFECWIISMNFVELMNLRIETGLTVWYLKLGNCSVSFALQWLFHKLLENLRVNFWLKLWKKCLKN